MAAVQQKQAAEHSQSYEAYKDSGVEWLGEIPKHWELIKLKYLSNIKTGEKDTIDKNDGGRYPFFIRSKKVQKIDTYSYDEEAVLTAGDGDIGKIFHYIRGKFEYHQRVYKFSKFKKITGKYLYYYLHHNLAQEVVKLSAKTTVDSLRLPMLQNFIVSIPPLQEQTAIANYLDKKTAKIDTAVAQKEKLITLLKERKQILIQNAVTKGLDPNVKLKDSGVEWIGEIPEHWEVKRLKYNLIQTNDKESSLETDYVYVGMENIESKTGKYLESINEVEGLANKFIKGDILFGKLRPYLAKVYLSTFDGICSTEFIVYRTEYPQYYKYLLLSDAFVNLVDSSTYGAKMPRASATWIGNQYIPIPPIKDQIKIAKYIETESQKIDKAIGLQQQQIAKLQEYKRVLIDSCVTGKVKVC